MREKNIKAVFFDVGDTLSRPASGHWFVPVRYQALFAEAFGGLEAPFVRDALDKALDFLDRHHFLHTEQQEFDLFVAFYRILLTECRYSPMTEALLKEFAYDMVYNEDKFIYFDDVFAVIPQLAENYKLGVISNTWPSLKPKMQALNLWDYFRVRIMSCELGVSKPHPRLYREALAGVNLPAEQTLFVDDSVDNLEGAARMGMQCTLINRYQKDVSKSPFPVIESLAELAPRFGL